MERESTQIGFEEASTVLPSVVTGPTAKNDGFGRYPFAEPSTETERAWWDEMRRVAREASDQTKADLVRTLKAWAPLLRAMTPAERQAFHKQRLDMAAGFTWPVDSARGDSERFEAEERLLSNWKTRLSGRG